MLKIMEKDDENLKKMTFSFRCDVETADEFRKICKKQGRTISFLMEKLMRDYVKKAKERGDLEEF